MKIIVLVVLLGISSLCVANGSEEYSAVRIAKLELTNSLEKYADKEQLCRESAIILNPKPIKEIGLTKDELKIALEYLYRKSFSKCSFSEASAVVTNLSTLLVLQPDTSDAAQESVKIITDDLAKVWLSKEKYLSINEIKRKKIENLINIDKPFNLIKSATALGL